MRLTLLFLNLKQWRHHKLRALVTVASIAIGVATYFAMRTTNDSLKRSLDQTVDRLSGKATLQVTADESGFPESILATVRSTPGVAAATGVVQFFCRTDLKDQTGLNYQFDRDPRAQLLIVGVDPDNEQKLRPLDPPAGNGWHVNPLLFLRFPGAAVISSTFAHRQGLAAGQMLPILSSKGRVELRVLRVLPPTDSIDGLFGGRVAIMDIHAVQDLVGVGRKLERIDLTTNPEGDIESVRQDLQARLGARLDVQRPLQRSREIEDASRTVRHGLLLTGLISMLVSAFIIYNAMSLAVGQRWKELGVLRALGVPRAKVRGMFLYEASVLGLIGSALGLIGGYFLAVLAARFTGGISLLLRIALPSNPLSAVVGLSHPAFNVEFAVEAALIGIVLSIASSWAPAQAACQLSPVLALHNIESRQQEKAVGWRRVVFGAAILIWGIALIALTPPVEGGLLQMSYEGLIFLGFIAMLPGLSFWTAASLRPFAGRLLGAEGTLAADSIALAPRRTSATAGAIMVGLAFVFSIWSFMQSQKAIIIGAFDKDVVADL
ncbi:MAG TPA: FtsX-like permease family protein, partial [Blastocatellia bacterium]|nr:FtsX-like permease family protein [Blastocatellia bacterium]